MYTDVGELYFAKDWVYLLIKIMFTNYFSQDSNVSKFVSLDRQQWFSDFVYLTEVSKFFFEVSIISMFVVR